DVVHDGVPVDLLEVAALLDVGVLVDDPGFLRREVRVDRGRQVVGDVLLQPVLAWSPSGKACARTSWAGVAGRDHARDGCEVELEAGEVGGDRDRLRVEAGALARAHTG